MILMSPHVHVNDKTFSDDEWMMGHFHRLYYKFHKQIFIPLKFVIHNFCYSNSFLFNAKHVH